MAEKEAKGKISSGDDKNPWTSAPFSIKTPEAVIAAELDFLRTVAERMDLAKPGNVLKDAIRRYETLWLPLLLGRAETEDTACLVPPLDVHWVWHCHMLSPDSYRQDCERLLGVVVDHKVGLSVTDDIERSKEIWISKYPQEPYDGASTDNVTECQYVPQSSYDLEAACVRQGDFYYNVSLPHYRNRDFIKNAVNRYKKFLYLKKCSPERFIVPCYDIDLVWHTHQLHPLIYVRDMQGYLGFTLIHDDTDTDRSPNSKLTVNYKETRALWRNTFKEEFALSGAMYRGTSSAGKMATMTPDTVEALRSRKAVINVQKVSLQRSRSRGAGSFTMSVDERQIANYEQHGLGVRQASNLTWLFDCLSFKLYLDDILNIKWNLEPSCQCCRFFRRKYECHCPVSKLLPEDGGYVGQQYSFELQRPIRTKVLIVEGCITIERLSGQVDLKIVPGHFENVVMPKSLEQLWGPVPFQGITSGSDVCVMATHALRPRNGKSCTLTVRVLHSIPLLMSAVQVFAGEEMVALAHLIAPDQVPNAKFSVGDRERGFIIKSNRGDWGFVFGSWKNMRKHVKGDYRTPGVHGNPGNLHVRFFKNLEPCQSFDGDVMEKDGFVLKMGPAPTVFDLKKGLISASAEHVAEKVAAAFAVAMLHVLCQPPPPGTQPPARHGAVGPVKPLTTGNLRQGRFDARVIDSSKLLLVAAAGWMVPTPSNYILAETSRSLRTEGVSLGQTNYYSWAYEWGLIWCLGQAEFFDVALQDASAGCGACASCSNCGSNCSN